MRPRMLLTTILILLTSCASAPTVTNDFCKLDRLITYDSRVDSEETQDEIVKHNARYLCVCEGLCPAN